MDHATAARIERARTQQQGEPRTIEVGALRLTAERTVRLVNTRFEAVSGHALSDVARVDVLSLVHPGDAAGLTRALNQAEERAHQRGGTIELPRVRARTRDGQPLLWTVAPEVDGTGRLSGFSIVVDDVAPMEHATTLAAQMRPLLDRLPDLVGLADDRGNVVYLNAAARAAFGVPDGDVVSVDRVFAPEAVDLYYRSIRPRLLRDGAWEGVVPLRRTDGGEDHVWHAITAGIGPTGTTVEWLLAIGHASGARSAPDR